MKFHLVTVLPEIFGSFVTNGIVHKAIGKGQISVETTTPRDFTTDRHRTVDDTPYGGGSGMGMMPHPIVDAMEHIDAAFAAREEARPVRILMSAQGVRFTQALAQELSTLSAITFVCGRYEGLDERAVRRCDREISIGDYVLMGGEVAAMVIIEAVARLIPGVLGNPGSILEESHATGLLEHPHYTRPAEFRSEGVPEVLSSGNHAEIARWRRNESLRRTLERRPELLEGITLTKHDRAFLASLQNPKDE